MATVSANAGVASNNAGAGTVAWANPTNAVGVLGHGSDAYADASYVGGSGAASSNYLNLQTFGFSILDSCLITQIVLAVNVSWGGGANTIGMTDQAVQLLNKGGNGVGANKATGAQVPSAFNDSTGTMSYTWSQSDLSSAGITAKDIISGNFGVVLQYQGGNTAGKTYSAHVNAVLITVTYSVPPPLPGSFEYPAQAFAAVRAAGYMMASRSGYADPTAQAILGIITPPALGAWHQPPTAMPLWNYWPLAVNPGSFALYPAGVPGEPGVAAGMSWDAKSNVTAPRVPAAPIRGESTPRIKFAGDVPEQISWAVQQQVPDFRLLIRRVHGAPAQFVTLLPDLTPLLVSWMPQQHVPDFRPALVRPASSLAIALPAADVGSLQIGWAMQQQAPAFPVFRAYGDIRVSPIPQTPSAPFDWISDSSVRPLPVYSGAVSTLALTPTPTSLQDTAVPSWMSQQTYPQWSLWMRDNRHQYPSGGDVILPDRAVLVAGWLVDQPTRQPKLPLQVAASQSFAVPALQLPQGFGLDWYVQQQGPRFARELGSFRYTETRDLWQPFDVPTQLSWVPVVQALPQFPIPRVHGGIASVPLPLSDAATLGWFCQQAYPPPRVYRPAQMDSGNFGQPPYYAVGSGVIVVIGPYYVVEGQIYVAGAVAGDLVNG